jgi:hypothetical protein
MKNLKKSTILNIRLISFLTFIFIEISFARSQGYMEFQPTGARQGAMGGSGVALIDVWSAEYNQAALAFMENPAIGFFYEQRFTTIGYQSFAGVLPLNNSAISFTTDFLGVKNYSSIALGAAYSVKLKENIAVSAKINYHHSQTSDVSYLRNNAITEELGFYAGLTDNFSIGAHIFNLIPFYFSKADSGFGTVFSLGMVYKPAEKVSVLFDLNKDTRYPLIYRGGVEYLYKDKLMFRVGVSSSKYAYDSYIQRYNSYSFGIGYIFKSFRVDLSFYNHYLLGFTPQLSMNYYF